MRTEGNYLKVHFFLKTTQTTMVMYYYFLPQMFADNVYRPEGIMGKYARLGKTKMV